jgi:hypothetical protein
MQATGRGSTGRLYDAGLEFDIRTLLPFWPYRHYLNISTHQRSHVDWNRQASGLSMSGAAVSSFDQSRS